MSEESDFTIREARSEANRDLQQANIESAAIDARVLLAHVLNLSPTGLFLRDPEPILPDELRCYKQLVKQRSMGIPVAYLTGYREFMGLKLHTEPGVLVPRPDTEPLVEWGLEWLQEHPQASVVDVGTGSGAIAISVVSHAPDRWVGLAIATDVSADALRIARSNADALLTKDRRNQLRFLRGNLTAPLLLPVDLLLTNLPYLTPHQIIGNPDLNHEPRLALDGGDDGLDLVRQMIADLPRILSPQSAVGFEIDPSQADEVQRLLAATLPEHRIEIVRDLAGDARHIVGSR